MQYINIVWQQLLSTGYIETFAVMLGVAQVVLALYNKAVNFWAGIGSTLLFIYLFFISKLYAEAGLNLYYFVVSIYGLIAWSGSSSVKELLIAKASKKEWGIAMTIAIVAFGAIYSVLRFATDSNVPIMDAFVSAFAWSGTWLMARRRLEYWLVLNISNAIAIPLLWYKGLYLTSLLTVVLFVIACAGYLKWKRIMLAQKK